jgi:hypothetical protein
MSLKVSLLLDGQLPPGETQPALDETVADAALRDRFTLYRLVGEGSRIEAGYDPLATDE